MSKQVALEYILISVLCAAGLWAFFHNIRKYAHKRKPVLYFEASVICAIVCAAADVLFAVREGNLVKFSVFGCYFSEMVYAVASLSGAYAWFVCSELEQESILVKTKGAYIICSLPMLIMLAFTLTTPIHHLCFYFDGNSYVRGPLNNLFTILTVIMIAISGIKALLCSFNHRFYLKRKILRTISLYSFGLLFFIGAQLAIGSILPFRTLAATVMVYIVQDSLLKSNIHRDIVSGVNNRAAMENYLRKKFNRADESSYFILFDLDKFKSINDKYGHVNGDVAIEIMGQALLSAVPGKFFVARYGGDEFVVLGRTKEPGDDAEIEAIIENVRNELTRKSEEAGIAFRIDFSVGYQNRTSEMETIPDLIAAADRKMYSNKRSKDPGLF